MNKKFQIFIFISLIIFCLVLIPVIHNIVDVLGLGRYNLNQDFNHSFTQGTGGVNVNFYLEITQEDRYIVKVDFNTISTGSIDPVGVVQLDYAIYKNDDAEIYVNQTFSTPSNSIVKTHYNLQCEKFDVVTCTGGANIRFLENSIEKEVSIDYVLSTVITTTSVEISNNWFVISMWLLVFDFGVIGYLVVLIAKTIRRIQFDKWYTEEHKKTDEEFFKKIRKRLEEEDNIPTKKNSP